MSERNHRHNGDVGDNPAEESSGRSHIELLEMSAQDARRAYADGELTETEWEKWATLNDLEADLSELKQDIHQAERDIIKGSIEADGDALVDSGEWFGVTVEYRLQIDSWMTSVLSGLEGTELDTLSEEDHEHVRNAIAAVLAGLWVGVETDRGMQDLRDVDDDVVKEWIKENWVDHPDIGIRGAYLCLGEQIQHATRREREMREKAQKFRGRSGSRDGGANETHGLRDTIGTLSGDE